MRITERTEAGGESDKDLLLRHHVGDAGAMGVLYRRHARFLFLYAVSMTRDPSLAEDLLQQAFLKVLTLDSVPRGDSIKGLLCASIRNLMRDGLRKADAERRHFPRLQAARPETAPSPEELEALSRALDQLPPDQREAVTMKCHGDFTFAEIARILDQPEPTVKSRYRYGIQKLSELLT